MSEVNELSLVSGAIADFITAPVDDEAYALARTRLLDATGIALAARQSPQAQSAILAAQTLLGHGNCHGMNGASGLSPYGAVLVNSTLIHALDFDDTYLSGAIHTHPTVIPAALAIADMKDATLGELIEATAIGTEVACWLSKAIGRDLHSRAFHPSAVLGSFGAVAAAARLLKLDREQIIDAIGLIGTVSAGTWQFEESWVKNWNVAVAAQSAVGAAIAASAGFKGPLRPIEGQYGLLATHLSTESRLLDLSTLGNPWLSAGISMKRYGCCHFLQSVVACTLEAASSIRPSEIKAVSIKLPSELAMRCVALPVETRKAPENTYRSRFAGHWLVARGLIDGRVDLNTFDDLEQNDSGFAALTDRISFEIADLDGYPDYWPAEIAIATTDGTTLSFRNDGRSSTFETSNLPSVEEKFRQNLEYAGMSRADADRILATLADRHAPLASLWAASQKVN